jgi:hypothetical protein
MRQKDGAGEKIVLNNKPPLLVQSLFVKKSISYEAGV